MNDVEKWSVHKKNEKNTTTPPQEQQSSNTPDVRNHEIRDEMSELQGRVGKLG